MIIKKEPKSGYTAFLTVEEDPQVAMDAGLLILEAGESFDIKEASKEVALLLLQGKVKWSAEGRTADAERINPFDYNAYCLHVCAGVDVHIEATEHSEIYVQAVENLNSFTTVFYSPAEIDIQRAGANGELQGAMRRNIKTVFDYSNAPYSNMVLGEVLNFPGKWSSYTPHHHPQPEVYFYRFDKEQGLGAGFANDNVFKLSHNSLLVIKHGFHSQVAAPGYAMFYVWGIRHLDGDPWIKTRIDDEEHTWMLSPNPGIWEEKV